MWECASQIYKTCFIKREMNWYIDYEQLKIDKNNTLSYKLRLMSLQNQNNVHFCCQK